MLIQEIYWLLTSIGDIYTYQEEQIFTGFKNISAFWEVIKEKEFHEQQQDETKESWITFDGEQPLELEIEEFPICLSSDLAPIQETNQQIVEDLHGMTKEDLQINDNEQEN